MNNFLRLIAIAWAAFFCASAQAQNQGTVANHAVAVGKGAAKQGLTAVAPGTAGFPLTSNGASSDPSFQFLPAIGGGTGQTSFAIGDLLQASSSTALAKLAAVATGNVLLSGGVGVVSSWGKVGLTTHVSGTLPIANGGTNDTGTAWSAFTSSPSCVGATITTNSSRNKTLGKTVFVQVEFTITVLSSCANTLTFTLPITAQSGGALAGEEISAGKGVFCRMVAASATANCVKYDVSNWLLNDHFVASGVVESQ